MIFKAIDLISKSGSSNQTVIIVMQYVLTLSFSVLIYGYIFGSFKIIPINDVNRLINFFIEGDFVKPVIVFLLTWKLFYNLIDWVISNWLWKLTNSLSDFFKEFLKDLNVNANKARYKHSFNLFLNTSILRKEGDNIIAGNSFYKLVNIIESVKDGNDKLDNTPVRKYIIIIIQLLILMWVVEGRGSFHHDFFGIIVSFIGLISIIYYSVLLCAIQSIEINIVPLHGGILKFKNESEKFLSSLENKEIEKVEFETNILEPQNYLND